MKLLLVEDSGSLRSIVRTMLSQMGYDDVVEATDGEEAWTCLHRQAYDALLTDWNMPNVSGIDLVRRIRQDAQLAYLPVVMLTTRSQRDDILSAYKAGADSYVTKPCKPSHLKARIEHAIAQQVGRRQRLKEAGEEIIRGCRRYSTDRRGPYVLIFEVDTDVDRLAVGQDNSLVNFYTLLAGALEDINHQCTGLAAGYSIESDTQEVTRLVKTDRHARVVLVSSRGPDGIPLARLLRFSGERLSMIAVVCDAIAGLAADHRDGLVKRGIQLLERTRLTRAEWVDVLAPHLIPGPTASVMHD